MALVSRYGNTNQFQENLIKGVNNYFNPPLKWIENGMCYMLTMEWILKYLEQTVKNADTAKVVFDFLTADISELRMVANNFMAYTKGLLKIEEGKAKDVEVRRMEYIINEAAIIVRMLSRNTRTATAYLPTFPIMPTPTALGNISLQPQTEAYFILFRFEDKGKIHGHAIGMIADSNRDYYIYDPNFGIIRATNISDVFASVLPWYTTNIRSIRVNVLIIR
ncbi:hypothetical protein D7X25_36040 [bacterium 1XD42-8]|nr:hypothetical protein D7X25_36040 [bacterium 1XD42-8]